MFNYWWDILNPLIFIVFLDSAHLIWELAHFKSYYPPVSHGCLSVNSRSAGSLGSSKLGSSPSPHPGYSFLVWGWKAFSRSSLVPQIYGQCTFLPLPTKPWQFWNYKDKQPLSAAFCGTLASLNGEGSKPSGLNGLGGTTRNYKTESKLFSYSKVFFSFNFVFCVVGCRGWGEQWAAP